MCLGIVEVANVCDECDVSTISIQSAHSDAGHYTAQLVHNTVIAHTPYPNP